MPQPRRKGHDSIISRTIYDKLLEHFREFPGAKAAAARSAGVSRATGSRAWDLGWPDRQLPAIKDVIQEEMILARSRRASAMEIGAAAFAQSPAGSSIPSGPGAADMIRSIAKDDATAARAQEGQMVKLSRANTIALMSATARLTSAAIDKAKDLEGKLRTNEVPLTPPQVVKFISSCAYLTKTAAEAAKLGIEMERLLLGEPTEIVGIDVRHMTLDDAARTIEVASRALARARDRGVVAAELSDDSPDGETVH